VEVDVDHPRRRGIGLGHERADGHDPGVVDQHVQRAEPGLDLIKEIREARAVGDVERERVTALAQLGGGGASRLDVEVAAGTFGARVE